jgi:argininosuccinate lyase
VLLNVSQSIPQPEPHASPYLTITTPASMQLPCNATHLQRAQPIRWSHWLLSYGTFLSTDLERLRQVIKRVNKSPLGAGAIVGHPFGIGREAMAEELGFEGIITNPMAAVPTETLLWKRCSGLRLRCSISPARRKT